MHRLPEVSSAGDFRQLFLLSLPQKTKDRLSLRLAVESRLTYTQPGMDCALQPFKTKIRLRANFIWLSILMADTTYR